MVKYIDYYKRLTTIYEEYKVFDRTKIPLCAAENYTSPFVKQGLISNYEGKYISGYIDRDKEKDFIGSDYLEKFFYYPTTWRQNYSMQNITTFVV